MNNCGQPVHIFHRVEEAVRDISQMENGGNVGMSKLSCGTRFSQKSLPGRLAIQKLRIDYLQGDIASQVRIESLVSNSHRTPSQLPQRPIRPPQNLEMFEFFRFRHALTPPGQGPHKSMRRD